MAKQSTPRQHMDIKWHDIVQSDSDVAAVDAPLKEKTSIIGRVGIMMLAVGTSANRVRIAMNKVSRSVGARCNIDIGLKEITFTCMEDANHYTQVISIPNTGVNTHRIHELEVFMSSIEENVTKCSVNELHNMLDDIEKHTENYKPWMLCLAAGAACCAFTFLLGGGPVEMLCAFIGAALGNYIRKILLEYKFALVLNVAVGVAVACLSYVSAITIFERVFGIAHTHHAGYICSMLFIIPGFPLITGGIDLAKLDLRSGIERLSYAGIIICTATLVGWVTATVVQFNPADFETLQMNYITLILIRMVTSFVGVFGFSMMFNSPIKMAATAGLIGTVANLVRLELIDFYNIPIGVAAFIGAFVAGIIASFLHKKSVFPRISLTVPSIVIMVPGMFMYKAVYYLGLYDTNSATMWFSKAFLVVVALPLGLIFARICTDREFRHLN